MSLAARLRSFLSAVTMRRRIEREMDEEWQFHLDARIDDLVATGRSRADAERAARREFGDVLRWKEEGREARGLRLLGELQSDAQYALRQMRRTPSVTFVITATLAIAIGANTAMFSLVDAVLLKTLPVPHPEQLKQLVWIARRHGFSPTYNGSARNNAAGERVATSFAFPVLTSIRERTTTFSDVFCFGEPMPLSVVLQGRSQLVLSHFVSGNFHRGLGVNAIVGRTLTDEDDHVDAPAVAVISYGLWQRAFGGAEGVIGQTLDVNRTPVTIVGVTPRSFFGIVPGTRPEITLPLWLTEIDPSTPRGTLAKSGYWGFEAMGRLKPGETAARAQAETETIVQQAILAAPPAEPYDPPRIVLDSGGRGLGGLRREFSGSLRLLMAIVGITLLVACANIAGLLIVRASARQREIGTRLALGAGRARLMRQLVTESVVLASAGGTLGFGIAYGVRHLLPLLVTEGSATVDLEMAVDARLLFFTAATCLVTGIACGLLPALGATRIDVSSLIGRSLGGTATRAARLWTGKALVIVQVAVSFVLLVGAGLFVRTLLNLRSETLGFQPDRLLTFRMAPAQNGYRDGRLNDFYERVLERVTAVPGVHSASLSRHALLAGASTRDAVAVPGSTARPTGANVHYIAPRYFETMGIPLLLGRDVGWQAREGGQRVALVNLSLARKLFGDAPPIGQRVIYAGGRAADAMEVIGVVADAKYATLRQPPPPSIYEPYRTRPQDLMTFAVRAAGDPEALVSAMRDAAAAVDRSVPLFDVWTENTLIDQALRQERVFANLVSGFALLSLLLACLGIYGTLSYSVARRTPEIGLRMALGAGRRDVVGLVLRESAAPVVIGALIGLAGAIGAARLVQSMLFGIAQHDAPTLAIALVVVAGCALVAAWLPSMRASRVEPMLALRQE